MFGSVLDSTCYCVCVQGYEKANATQDTMYQVRWGADYLMKMIGHGSGAGAGNLEIIYQVYPFPSNRILVQTTAFYSFFLTGTVPSLSFCAALWGNL